MVSTRLRWTVGPQADTHEWQGRPIFSPGYYAAEARLHHTTLATELENNKRSYRHGSPTPLSDDSTPPSPSGSTTSRHEDEAVIERFLDPTDPRARSITLEGLTSSLTPLARSYVLALPSDVLHRATSFEENTSRDGLLTIKIYHSSMIIGLCQTRVPTDEDEMEDVQPAVEEEGEREGEVTPSSAVFHSQGSSWRRASPTAHEPGLEGLPLPGGFLSRRAGERRGPPHINETARLLGEQQQLARRVLDAARLGIDVGGGR
jgi:hypothetical protein